ncbi:MAG: phosphatidate cytidylyltransferase [Phycisphaerae bacterium]
MAGKMTKRIVFGSLLIAVLVGLFVLDGWLDAHTALPRGIPLTGLVVLLVAVGFLEVSRLAGAVGPKPLAISGILGSCLLATAPFWWQLLSPAADVPGEMLMLAAGVVVMAVFLEQMIRFRTERGIPRLGATFLGIAYLAVGAGLILHMRLGFGLPTVVLFLAAVKFTDIGAYFTGSFLGKHKMIRWLSPGKTWEGLLGGLVTAGAASALVAWVFAVFDLPTALSWDAAIGFGVVVGLFGQFADLCESLLKRSADIKDSGGLVPEFGGVLDMVDSPLLSVPIAMSLLYLMT